MFQFQAKLHFGRWDGPGEDNSVIDIYPRCAWVWY